MAGRWVCLPGTLCSGEVFEPMLDAMGVTERVTVEIDKHHVDEMVPLLRAVVRPGDVVCGFSLGAIVAAHAVPELDAAKALVFLALNPGPDDPSKAASRLRFRDRVLSGDATGAINKGWKRMSVEQGAAAQARAEAMATRLAPLIAPQTDLVMSRGDAREKLSEGAMPMVFATGTRDQVTPPELVQKLPETVERGRFVALEALGHFALLEDPELVARSVRQALENVGVQPVGYEPK